MTFVLASDALQLSPVTSYERTVTAVDSCASSPLSRSDIHKRATHVPHARVTSSQSW